MAALRPESFDSREAPAAGKFGLPHFSALSRMKIHPQAGRISEKLMIHFPVPEALTAQVRAKKEVTA